MLWKGTLEIKRQPLERHFSASGSITVAVLSGSVVRFCRDAPGHRCGCAPRSGISLHRLQSFLGRREDA
jgi:hypothetical protein